MAFLLATLLHEFANTTVLAPDAWRFKADQDQGGIGN